MQQILFYIGQMLVGIMGSWFAPVISKFQDPDQTPLPEVISDTLISWIGTTIFLGVVIGPHVTGYLSNIIGRKPCLFIGGAISALSFTLIIFTRNLATMFALRISMGLGVGILSVGNIVYIGEIGAKNIRGALLTAIGIAGSFGVMLMYSVSPFMTYTGTGYLGLTLSIIFIIALYFIPESPAFQVLKGDKDAAKQTLQNLGRFDEIVKVLETTKDQETTKPNVFIEIFTVKSNRKAFMITMPLLILQQLSGISSIVLFVTHIFGLAGSSVTPHIATIIIGGCQIASSCVVPYFVERSGRKILLLVSTAVTSISLVVLGICFYLEEISHPSLEYIGWLPLVSLMMYFMFYDLGFGPIPSTLTGEMFRLNIRGPGSALTITTAWLFGFCVAIAFNFMVNTIGGHWTFWIYGFFCAAAFLFTAVFVPETKGKSLIEIQEMLSR